MSFNPGITKQPQEIVFSQKKNDTSHPILSLNKARIQRQSVEKHLGHFLDGTIWFCEHIDVKIKREQQ